MGRALVLHPDGDLIDINLPATGSSLHVMYEALSCSCVDVVGLTEHLDMWIDDEGLFTGRPVNVPATLLARRYGHVHQSYVGPVLLCGVTPGGDSVNLDPDRIRALLTSLEDVAAAV